MADAKGDASFRPRSRQFVDRFIRTIERLKDGCIRLTSDGVGRRGTTSYRQRIRAKQQQQPSGRALIALFGARDSPLRQVNALRLVKGKCIGQSRRAVFSRQFEQRAGKIWTFRFFFVVRIYFYKNWSHSFSNVNFLGILMFGCFIVETNSIRFGWSCIL